MKKIYKLKYFKLILLLLALPLWIYWDVNNADLNSWHYISFTRSSELKAGKTEPAAVAIIRSDDTALQNPSAIDTNPSTETVEQMVTRAIKMAGGFPAIKSGMSVLIKPNLVESTQPSGSGTDTDVRVVEAVVKYVDGIDHGKINIIVGDGSPRPYTTFEKNVAVGKTPWGQLFGNADSSKDAGYQKMLNRLLKLGINIRLSNLNGNSDTNPWSELKEYKFADGGSAQPQQGSYYIHQDVLNADVYITVPVMKIHDPGITCALKNQIGLAPSSLYGFSKTSGVAATGALQGAPEQHKLLHLAQAPYNWTDKEIVDLSRIAKIKYAVVDALMCLEISKTTLANKSNQVRRNLIIAGADPVSVDHVCARLMGLNPDDIEHITLAERMGIGTNNPDKIIIKGSPLEMNTKRFKKNTSIPDQIFGQSNRDWIISKAFTIVGVADPINHEFIPNEADIAPLPAENGWSESCYFINDRINLKDYFSAKSVTANNIAAYVFTYFYSPADTDAELWTGSDEALKIFLNGSVVYNFNGNRSFGNTVMFIDPATKIKLKKGLNRLLIKTIQNINSSYFDFSLNICDVESDANFRGSRVWGLKFFTDARTTSVSASSIHLPVGSFELLNCYPNPFNNSVQIKFDAFSNQEVTLSVFDLQGRLIRKIFSGTPNGTHLSFVWDGNDESGKCNPSGVYFINLKGAKGESVSQKVILLK